MTPRRAGSGKVIRGESGRPTVTTVGACDHDVKVGDRVFTGTYEFQ